jgi:hypothetical protein
MDRRTFMMTSAWFSTAACAWPQRSHAAGAHSALAVVDVSLASGRAFANYAPRLNVPVFEVDDDIGRLWYTTLAPRLAAAPARLICVTRASDGFVLARLAASSRFTMLRENDPGAIPDGSVTFLLEHAT